MSIQMQITKTFDELAEGMYVTIRNPQMVPVGDLTPKTNIPRKDDGTPVDREKAKRITNAWLGTLIADWNVVDVTDLSGETWMTEVDADSVAKAPTAVTAWISKQVIDALTPQ